MRKIISVEDVMSKIKIASSITEGAKIDIRNLNTALRAIPNGIRTERAKIDYQRGQKVINIVIPRREIPEAAGIETLRIIKNLWSALNGIVLAITERSLDGDIEFPTSRSQEFKTARVRRIIDGMPRGVGDLVRSIEPYYRGNGEPLWITGQLRRRKKTNIIEFAATPNVDRLRQMATENGWNYRGVTRKGGDNDEFIVFDGLSVMKLDEDIEITVNVVFRGVQVANPQPVVGILLEACDLVARFCVDLRQLMDGTSR